ncbi:MAG TPA: chloride channel protein [Candidatus Sulfotelmatobacter sp.]|nr:chloride channel protein [Candidatus Sulfotelmatobacter sp.]
MPTETHAGRLPKKRPVPQDRLLAISLLAIVVGALGGFVAEALLRTINFLTDLLFFGQWSTAYLPPNTAPHHWWFLFLPAAGGLGVGLLVQYFSPEVKGDGIPEAMAVVLTKGSIVKPRVGFFKPLSAAITVGTGGPFGAEGPIIQTGAALGSIIGQLIPSSPSERRILLACGAAAGLAGVFKTPFAGLMMAIELLVFEFRARSFIPIALASATGTMVAMGFRGAQPVFPLATNYQFHAGELPFFVILGIGCAGLAWAMTRALYLCEEFFEDLKIWFPLVPALGGLFVGILGLFYPQVLGTGYAVIADVLAVPQPLHKLVGIGLAKLAAFAVALGSGASGGTFAPALMIGGSLGAAYGSVVHLFLPHSSAIGIYGMVATAALFGSIYRATPSAILFMLEVTGAYNAFLPVFLVAVVADLAVHYLMRHTINTERLVRRGTLVPDAYTVDPMKLMRVRDVMNTDVDTVRPQQRVSEFLTESMGHGSVPVVDEQGHPVGMLRRSDLLAAKPEELAGDLAKREFPFVYSDEIVHDVALRFVQEELGRCPVVNRETGELAGILTAFDLLKAKDWEHLQELSEPARLWGRRHAEADKTKLA